MTTLIEELTTEEYNLLMGFREGTLCEYSEQCLWDKVYITCPHRSKDNKCNSHIKSNDSRNVCSQSNCAPFYFLKKLINYNLKGFKQCSN